MGEPKIESYMGNGVLESFLVSVKEIFRTQCSAQVRVLRPAFATKPMGDVAIAAELKLASNGFKGKIILSFPKAAFLSAYNRMFDEQHETIAKECEDMAGELLNMIYGLAKKDLNQKGHTFVLSLPSILSRSEMERRFTDGSTALVVPFEGDCGNFYFEIVSREK